MKAPHRPADEAPRLAALHGLDILDTSPEERFDRLTRLARGLFDVPVALVGLIDAHRQWFKSRQGLEACETSRDSSFCGHSILGDEVFLVPDASRDERFADNPLVTGEPRIRFYAGCPLRLPCGSKVGTLCLIDRVPRSLDEHELVLLRDLAHMAEQELAAVQIATTDEGTQLSNRRGFGVLARQALALCRRLERPASLLYLDLDAFKAINDRFGHAEGDRALKAFALRLRGAVRSSDVVGRLGGDEFAVFATDATAEGVVRTVERLRRELHEYSRAAGRGYDIGFSYGSVSFDPDRHDDIADLLEEADARMFAEKRARQAARGQSCGHAGAALA